MALSYARYEGTGSQTIFPVAFEYISKAHVYVNVDQKLVSYSVDELNNQVLLDVAPELGAEVFIYRRTPRNRTYSDFKRGNPFGQRNVNNSFLWQLYISQEIAEGTWSDEFAFNGNLDMNGYRIVNLGTPIDKHDAVTKEITDGLDNRIASLEGVEFGESGYITWQHNAVEGETVLRPPYVFTSARVYIEGVKQRGRSGAKAASGESFWITNNNEIHLVEPLLGGEWIDVELGVNPEEVVCPLSTGGGGGEVYAPHYHYSNTMFLFKKREPREFDTYIHECSLYVSKTYEDTPEDVMQATTVDLPLYRWDNLKDIYEPRTVNIIPHKALVGQESEWHSRNVQRTDGHKAAENNTGYFGYSPSIFGCFKEEVVENNWHWRRDKYHRNDCDGLALELNPYTGMYEMTITVPLDGGVPDGLFLSWDVIISIQKGHEVLTEDDTIYSEVLEGKIFEEYHTDPKIMPLVHYKGLHSEFLKDVQTRTCTLQPVLEGTEGGGDYAMFRIFSTTPWVFHGMEGLLSEPDYFDYRYEERD